MQEIIVFLIVLAAFAYLVRQLWPSKNKSGGCAGCSSGGCDTKGKQSTPAPSDNLIQISMNGTGHKSTLRSPEKP